MKSNFNDVGEFHDRFNLDHVTCNASPCNGTEAGPRVISDELLRFRLKFLAEELKETAKGMGFSIHIEEPIALENVDHVQAFDGLLDLAYVTLGTAHMLGYPWQEGWEAVQRANMQKERVLRAEQSLRGSTYDVIKPEGWKPPNIALVLNRHGFKV